MFEMKITWSVFWPWNQRCMLGFISFKAGCHRLPDTARTNFIIKQRPRDLMMFSLVAMFVKTYLNGHLSPIAYPCPYVDTDTGTYSDKGTSTYSDTGTSTYSDTGTGMHSDTNKGTATARCATEVNICSPVKFQSYLALARRMHK